MHKGFGFASAAIWGALVLSPLYATAETVGQVAYVQVYGYETPPQGAREPIFLRDDVVTNTELETVIDGRLDVKFVDNTQLIVGSSSKVKVDRFVFDPSKSSGDVALNVSKGLMRFVSGRMASQSYKVRTPTATLGVRGTDFVVAVAEDGSTTVSVISGEVEMTSGSGDSGGVGAGSTGSTSGASVSVSQTVSIPAIAAASFGGDVDGPSDSGEAESESSSHGG